MLVVVFMFWIFRRPERGLTHWLTNFFAGNPYRMEFVDLVRFNSNKKIAQMLEFFDTKQLHGHIDDHESSQSEQKKADGS